MAIQTLPAPQIVERELTNYQRNLVDTCFEEGNYHSAIALLDKLRHPSVKPCPSVRAHAHIVCSPLNPPQDPCPERCLHSAIPTVFTGRRRFRITDGRHPIFSEQVQRKEPKNRSRSCPISFGRCAEASQGLRAHKLCGIAHTGSPELRLLRHSRTQRSPSAPFCDR